MTHVERRSAFQGCNSLARFFPCSVISQPRPASAPLNCAFLISQHRLLPSLSPWTSFFSPCFHHQLLLNDSYPFHSGEYFETLPPMASGTHLQPHAMSFSGTGD
jgi:hypothetical protein